MTNIEFADMLEKLARRYRDSENLARPALIAWTYTKTEAVTMMKALGGKWLKPSPDKDSYSMDLESVTFPGLKILLPRDKVCKKIVTYDCEPLLSPEEEAELTTAANAA